MTIGLILAGGRSSRMGKDVLKPLLEVGGRPMIAHVSERLRPHVDAVLVSTHRPDLFDIFGDDCIGDAASGHAGPLAGLQSAAMRCRAHGVRSYRVVCLPGDTPFLPLDLVPRLLQNIGEEDMRIASFEGRLQPTCAVWPRRALEWLEGYAFSSDASPSLRSVMAPFRPNAVDFRAARTAPAGNPFFNVNTPADLETARRHWVSGDCDEGAP